MIADLKPYQKYRSAEGGWLGDIPSHWKIRRMKYVVRETDSRSTRGNEQLLRVSQYTGVTQRRRADGLDEPDTRADSLVGYKRVEPNDLVINIMLAWNGSMGVSRYSGIASPAYCVYRFAPDLHPWYFHNLLRSPAYKARIKASSTGVVESRLRLYSDDLGRIEAILPPPDEQAAIVRFLDWANGRLERAIRAKRKVIALLNEQKQAIIHRAVTRGLDPTVPLKPSGIPWLGYIPSTWNGLQVRRVVSFVTSGSRGWANYYSDDGLIFLQSGNLGRSMSLNLSYIQHVRPPDGAEGERTRVRRNDVLICVTGALTGNVAIVDQDLPAPAFVNQHVALVRPKQGMIEPRFLAYALHSEVGRTQFKTNEYGGTKQGLGLGDVKSVFIPVPPLPQQRAICAALDTEVAGFKEAISRLEREIELLREYRTRIVADVVTGKLDVRAAAAQLPAEVEAPELLADADDLAEDGKDFEGESLDTATDEAEV